MEKVGPTRDGFGKYMGSAFLIGLGFFTMGLMDPLYDNYLPIFLGKYIPSMGIVGAVMTLDNIFAIFLIPIVSIWSDRTRTKLGRRMPFIIVLLPLTALFFSSLPYAAESSLAALIICVFFLNVAKQAARGPVIALMPDTIPADHRSEANGVINTMGGIAAITGTIGLARLMDLDMVLPLLGPTKGKLPFPLAGLLVVTAAVFLVTLVRERPPRTDGEGTGNNGTRKSFMEDPASVAKSGDGSAIRILVSIFLWFLAYQGILPFLGKYGIEALGTSLGTSALAMGMVGISYALFAIPSGYLSRLIGRKRAIRISLAALSSILLFLFFFLPASTALGLSGAPRLYLFWLIMFAFGIFWVTVVTNSFPMLWQLSDYGTVGVYTGLYYTFSQAAAITAPPITGFIIDLAGYPGIFLFGALCMAAAWFTMGGVIKGEAEKATP